MARLYHCIWRRWSIKHFNLDEYKIYPLSINWNKEIDVTVLYGPDLVGIHEREQPTPTDFPMGNIKEQGKQLLDVRKEGSGSSLLKKGSVFYSKVNGSLSVQYHSMTLFVGEILTNAGDFVNRAF